MVAPAKYDCVFLEKYTTAPAPSRDYYGLKVTRNQIYIYEWRIARHSSIFPIVRKESMEDFLEDSTMQYEINQIFGPEVLAAALDVVYGQPEYLSHLPHKILNKILCLLDLRDVAAVARTCKKLSTEVSRSNELWEKLFFKYHKKPLKLDERLKAEAYGWRKYFKIRRRKKPGAKQLSIENNSKPRSSSSTKTVPSRTQTLKTSSTATLRRPEVAQKKKTSQNGKEKTTDVNIRKKGSSPDSVLRHFKTVKTKKPTKK